MSLRWSADVLPCRESARLQLVGNDGARPTMGGGDQAGGATKRGSPLEGGEIKTPTLALVRRLQSAFVN
ncbi:hypothetical protein JTE90_002309 [Oedothorax gibbosus]|uniref:Uncharacterized protein n=1 Tax=Oedothorax gibbosus TaxID=931172 RepID=A0AAV6UJ92_9ARAC|nr:hypothetical protein JTE90_002309 [Oedothorax gibbosus]